MSRYTPRDYEDLDEIEDEVLREEALEEFAEKVTDPVEQAQILAWDYSRRLLKARGTYVGVAYTDRATSLPTLVEAFYSRCIEHDVPFDMHSYVVALEACQYEQ